MALKHAFRFRQEFFSWLRKCLYWEMVLFDGGRRHGVAPFEGGQCYSLVFNTCDSYVLPAQKAKKKLVEIGAIWPDGQACAHWNSLVGPTACARKAIAECRGCQKEPIQWQNAPFISIGQGAMALSAAASPVRWVRWAAARPKCGGRPRA